MFLFCYYVYCLTFIVVVPGVAAITEDPAFVICPACFEGPTSGIKRRAFERLY